MDGSIRLPSNFFFYNLSTAAPSDDKKARENDFQLMAPKNPDFEISLEPPDSNEEESSFCFLSPRDASFYAPPPTPSNLRTEQETLEGDWLTFHVDISRHGNPQTGHRVSFEDQIEDIHLLL